MKQRYDIFISYRRRDAGVRAEHLKDLLDQAFPGRISFDRENLTGEFNIELIRRIERCRDFVLVLGKNSLEYSGDADEQFYRDLASLSEEDCIRKLKEIPRNFPLDYVRVEIGRALHRKNRPNIIPVVPERTADYSFSSLSLPGDIAAIKDYDAVFYSDNPDALFKDIVPKIKKRLVSKPLRSALWRGVAAITAIAACVAIALIGCLRADEKRKLESCRTYRDYEAFAASNPMFFKGRALAVLADFDKLKNGGFAYINNTAGSSRRDSLPVEWSRDISYLQLRVITGMLDSMMVIPAGKCVMGTDNPLDDEDPPHEVEIADSYCIGKFEVKRGEWDAVMHDRAVSPDSACLPMCGVSWQDCQRFVEALSSMAQGVDFALPTDEQWEYAAKGGGVHSQVPAACSLGQAAWHRENSNGRPHASFEGDKEPNKFELYNILGNVQEWCQDARGEHKRSVRGGSYATPPADMAISYLDAAGEESREETRGMRLVINLPRQE